MSQANMVSRAKAFGLELKYRYDGLANAKAFEGNKDLWALIGRESITTYPHLPAVADALTERETACDPSHES